jgi:hypothetical protein
MKKDTIFVDSWNREIDGDLNRENFEKKIENKFNHRFQACKINSGLKIVDHKHTIAKGGTRISFFKMTHQLKLINFFIKTLY